MNIWPIRKTDTVNCADVRRHLSTFLDCELTLDKQAAIQRHVDNCRDCREELRSLEATVALLRHLPAAAPVRPIASPDFRPSRAYRAVPALGMVTVMVSLLLVFTFTADLTNLFQTTPTTFDISDNSESEIGGRSTLDIYGSPQNGDPDQDGENPALSAQSTWVRPLEYSLAGTAVALGGFTFILWHRSRRPRPVERRP